jgi:hypothetical protein
MYSGRLKYTIKKLSINQDVTVPSTEQVEQSGDDAPLHQLPGKLYTIQSLRLVVNHLNSQTGELINLHTLKKRDLFLQISQCQRVQKRRLLKNFHSFKKNVTFNGVPLNNVLKISALIDNLIIYLLKFKLAMSNYVLWYDIIVPGPNLGTTISTRLKKDRIFEQFPIMGLKSRTRKSGHNYRNNS